MPSKECQNIHPIGGTYNYRRSEENDGIGKTDDEQQRSQESVEEIIQNSMPS